MGDLLPETAEASSIRQRHHQAPSSSLSSSSSAAENPIARSKIGENAIKLLKWDDLPSWRRDNAFIHSGYRQTHPSYFHTLSSLTHIHNESVNIWSHFLGAISAIVASLYTYFLVRPRYDSASDTDVLVWACFFGGAVLCLGMSATFHALLSHSSDAAKWGNKLDYTGIVLLIVGSYVPALYYGFFCQPQLLSLYLGLIFLLGFGCAVVSWVDKFRTPQWRAYRAGMFIGLGVSGVVPVLHGITIYGYQGLEDRMSISWVISHGALYIFGAVLYAVCSTQCSYGTCLPLAKLY